MSKCDANETGLAEVGIKFDLFDAKRWGYVNFLHHAHAHYLSWTILDMFE